ncbi:MAG: hypothetical protein HY259_10140 [Chloroflexi bacterium]|nr:hypothetical protein [Chloroflexota bacterium]MBI3733798.1 hypothetical protein [Chloroflexota bacterium]
MELTIQVPDDLGRQLERFRQRLPEVLERGLRELIREDVGGLPDEAAIIELLTSAPGPEQVLAIQPSAALQARASDLLARNKAGELSAAEEYELERYLMLEHLVRLAKAHAYQQVADAP